MPWKNVTPMSRSKKCVSEFMNRGYPVDSRIPYMLCFIRASSPKIISLWFHTVAVPKPFGVPER